MGYGLVPAGNKSWVQIRIVCSPIIVFISLQHML